MELPTKYEILVCYRNKPIITNVQHFLTSVSPKDEKITKENF